MEADKGPEISLKMICRQFIRREREFYQQCVPRSNEQRPFVMHAAKLNLPGSTFRVLITHEDMPVAQEDVKRSEKLPSSWRRREF